MTLKDMRRAAGLTQVASAAALGVTQASLWAWERGNARPTLEKLKPMAALYGVTLEALVGAITGEEEPYGNRLLPSRPGYQGQESPATH